MVEAFDAQQWVLRMGKELERVACDADPCFFPRNAPPPWGVTKEQIREHEKRQCRDLACAARHDETAAKLFAKSSLGLNADHQDARSALLEHPLLGPRRFTRACPGTCEGAAFTLPPCRCGRHLRQTRRDSYFLDA